MPFIISPIIRIVLKTASLALFALTALCGFGGYISPEIWAFPSFLVLVFPYLAIATIAVTAIWLLTGRWIIGAIGVLSLIICWSPLSMAVPVSFNKSADSGQTTFSLLTWNTLHFEDPKNPGHKGTRGLRELVNSGADIICTQELYPWDLSPDSVRRPNEALIDSLKAIYPYQVTSNVRDLSIFSKYPLEPLDDYEGIDRQSCTARLVVVNIRGHKLNLLNLHLDSYRLSDKEQALIKDAASRHDIDNSVREFKGSVYHKMKEAFPSRAANAEKIASSIDALQGPTVVCGDFNDVPASWTYRTFLKHGFSDAYADTEFGYTYTFNSNLLFFHLDQVFYRGGLKPLSVERIRTDISDHYPLLARFAFTK